MNDKFRGISVKSHQTREMLEFQIEHTKYRLNEMRAKLPRQATTDEQLQFIAQYQLKLKQLENLQTKLRYHGSNEELLELVGQAGFLHLIAHWGINKETKFESVTYYAPSQDYLYENEHIQFEWQEFIFGGNRMLLAYHAKYNVVFHGLRIGL